METSVEAPAVPGRFSWRRFVVVRPAAGSVPLWAHVVLWLFLLGSDAFLLYLSSVSPKLKLRAELEGRSAWFLLADVLSATLFYVNWLVLIPRTLARGRVGAYVAAALATAAAYAAVRLALPFPIWGPRENVSWSTFNALLITGLFFVFASAGLRITRDYLHAQRNRRELERQQLLTELALLRTQVNPHFLFNTLNNIYTLTVRKSDRAPEAVLRLADIMRYLLYDSRPDVVPLHQELAHLRSYLDLQRLRLPASAPDAIRFDLAGLAADGPDAEFPVAPLLLLPLVENAFKHGDLAARPVAVHLALTLTAEGVLRFEVRNAVAPADARRELPETAGGVGLVNLRRRLQLLYPGRHQLHVRAAATEHAVTLELQGPLTAPA